MRDAGQRGCILYSTAPTECPKEPRGLLGWATGPPLLGSRAVRRATIYFACAAAVALGIGITYRLTHGLPGPTRVKMHQAFKVTDICSIKPMVIGGWNNVLYVEVTTDNDTFQTEEEIRVGGYALCNRRDGRSIRATVMEITENDVLFLFSSSPYN